MITEAELKDTGDRLAQIIAGQRKDIDGLKHFIHSLLMVAGPVELAWTEIDASGKEPGIVSCEYNPEKDTRIYRALPRKDA